MLWSILRYCRRIHTAHLIYAEGSEEINRQTIISAFVGEKNDIKGCSEDFLFSAGRLKYRTATKRQRQQALSLHFATFIYCCE